MADPYGMDFLQRIVAVNFASGGYLTITVTASVGVKGSSTPPPFPDIALAFSGKGVKLVDSKVLSQTTTSVPPHTTTTPIVTTILAYLPWLSGLPVPTLENFQLSNGLVGYGTQFAQLIDINNGGFRTPASNGVSGTPVSFSVQSSVTNYIASFNARFTGGANFVTGYFPLPGATGDILVAPVLFLTEITQTTGGQTTTVPGSASATIVKEFLVQVPSALTTITVTASGGGSTVVKGYHGSAPASISKVIAAPDSTASADASCTVTSHITKGVTTVTAS